MWKEDFGSEALGTAEHLLNQMAVNSTMEITTANGFLKQPSPYNLLSIIPQSLRKCNYNKQDTLGQYFLTECCPCGCPVNFWGIIWWDTAP